MKEQPPPTLLIEMLAFSFFKIIILLDYSVYSLSAILLVPFTKYNPILAHLCLLEVQSWETGNSQNAYQLTVSTEPGASLLALLVLPLMNFTEKMFPINWFQVNEIIKNFLSLRRIAEFLTGLAEFLTEKSPWIGILAMCLFITNVLFPMTHAFNLLGM